MSLKTEATGDVSRESRARARNFHAAFTLVELLVVVAVVAILFLMMSVPLAGPRAKAQRIKCVSNLKNVGLAFRIYATEHRDLFAWESTNATGQIKRDFANDPYFYLLKMTNELATPQLLTCPSDSRPRADYWSNFSRANISYFVSQDASATLPQSFLTGDRNVTTNGVTLKTGIHRLRSDADVGWDNTQHKKQGNIVMGDGSVQQFNVARFREQFRNSGLKNITLAIP
jgi:prepilin-type N-terminal cleavage/methylation domain-containing protein/prepilin-type processing-associated H-X9-DG protein